MDIYDQDEDQEVNKNILVKKSANRIVLIWMVLEIRMKSF